MGLGETTRPCGRQHSSLPRCPPAREQAEFASMSQSQEAGSLWTTAEISGKQDSFRSGEFALTLIRVRQPYPTREWPTCRPLPHVSCSLEMINNALHQCVWWIGDSIEPTNASFDMPWANLHQSFGALGPQFESGENEGRGLTLLCRAYDLSQRLECRSHEHACNRG